MSGIGGGQHAGVAEHAVENLSCCLSLCVLSRCFFPCFDLLGGRANMMWCSCDETYLSCR